MKRIAAVFLPVLPSDTADSVRPERTALDINR